MLFLSLNVRGLAQAHKRRDVFNWLSQSKKDEIILLQETHCSKELENKWKNEWNGECITTTYSAQSRGVAILLKRNLDYEIHATVKDDNGRYIFIDVTVDQKRFVLGNVYGPNEDSPEFFEEVFNVINDFGNQSIIIGGDWNVVQDFQLDTYNYTGQNNPRARKKLLEQMEGNNLNDIFRILHPKEKKYTWRSKTPIKRARLDYFLASPDFLAQTTKIVIEYGYRSDHSAVSIDVKLINNTRGRGYWKFNPSLLHDVEYVRKVKQTITETEDLYRANGTDNGLSIDNRSFWEMLKLSIRGISVKHSSEVKKNQNIEEKDLIRKLNELSNKTDVDSELQKEEAMDRLELIRGKKMEGVILRSKATWNVQGEINSSYFCKLEQRNYINKTITRLLNEEGQETLKDDEILNEMKRFYSNLYATKIDSKEKATGNIFFPENDIKLSDEEKNTCEGDLTEHEFLTVLKQMKNGKSPGVDGFTPEFYKFFWADLKRYMINSFQESYASGEMSNIQKESIITCLPKPGKDRTLLKNWRPISLINIDYKILSAAIANRFKMVIPSIISETQKGFIKGRFIGENTRMIYDVLAEAEKRSIPGLLLLIDFEKAFDSIEWGYLHKVLLHYNFGPNIRKWVETLYKNISSRIINNGKISESFKLTRGVRQGDPLSPYLFILAVEPLANAIKRNKEIKGIKIDDIEYLLSQFADDTTFTLDGTEASLKNTLDTLHIFAKISGLKLNTEKTKAIWFGSKKKCKMKLCQNLNLDWTEGDFKLLGIIFNIDLQKIPKLNLDHKKTEIEALLRKWEYRNLTPYGKITIIKTLALSKLVHVMSIIPVSSTYIKDIEKILYNFLWNGKKGIIKRSSLVLDYEEGGLKMIDVGSFEKGLKIAWVKRLMTANGKWQSLAKRMIGKEYSSFMFQLDQKSLNEISKTISNAFWKQVIKAWGEIQKNPRQMVLWKNINIKVENKTLYYKNLANNGIFLASHLLTNNQQALMSYQEFKQKYPEVEINFIKYEGLITKIPRTWKTQHLGIVEKNKERPQVEIICESKKPTQYAYQILVRSISEQPIRSQEKWEGGINDPEVKLDWKNLYLLCQKATTDKRLRIFQFKILHRRVATNYYLHKMNIKDTPQCTFCDSIETIEHLFYHCKHSERVLKYLQGQINILTHFNIQMKMQTIILGHKIEDTAIYFLILCYKYFIYKCKLNEEIPNVHAFKQYANKKLILEKESYRLSGKIPLFEKLYDFSIPLFM